MRVAVFFVYLILNSLIGGNYFHLQANTGASHSSHARENFNHHRVKFTLNDLGGSIIENADLDIEEECLNEDEDLQNENRTDFSYQKDIATGNSYLARSHLFALDYLSHHLNASPQFCGKANPIYLTNRALRL